MVTSAASGSSTRPDAPTASEPHTRDTLLDWDTCLQLDCDTSPLIAIVGRPNVGKSTLFNRIVGSRRAIVGDEPGITRDRLYGDAEWNGHKLRIVDTGGILPEEKDFIPAEIYRQARVALEEAAGHCDGGRWPNRNCGTRSGARALAAQGKPAAVSCCEQDRFRESNHHLLSDFHRLGVKQMFPVSAEHGRGIDDLLDAVLASFQNTHHRGHRGHGGHSGSQITEEVTQNAEACARGQGRHHRASQRRQIHFVEPTYIFRSRHCFADPRNYARCRGRTGRARWARFRFIDTAGIRRKGKTHLMAEKLSVVMARKHLEAADIALLVIDATEGVSQLDASIAGYAHESGRSTIIVVNKWDLMISGQKKEGRPTKAERMRESKRPGDREAYEERLRYELKFLSYAPMVFISAETGAGTEKIFPLLEQVASERRKRIGTSDMNRFLERVDFERASVPMRQRVKILYMTQASVAPPTFVLFTNRDVKLHFSYQRFLENQIRACVRICGHADLDQEPGKECSRVRPFSSIFALAHSFCSR